MQEFHLFSTHNLILSAWTYVFSPIDSPVKKENDFPQIFNVFRPSGNLHDHQTKITTTLKLSNNHHKPTAVIFK